MFDIESHASEKNVDVTQTKSMIKECIDRLGFEGLRTWALEIGRIAVTLEFYDRKHKRIADMDSISLTSVHSANEAGGRCRSFLTDA